VSSGRAVVACLVEGQLLPARENMMVSHIMAGNHKVHSFRI
jgi:hypothetical protein